MWDANEVLHRLRQDCTDLAGGVGQPKSRTVGTPGHLAARALLVERVREIGLVPALGSDYVLPYRRDFQDFANVVTRLPGGVTRDPGSAVRVLHVR